MKKFNYRVTVNINEKIMKLGFRGQLPPEMEGQRIRIQAIFSQRQVDRRFPMEVVTEETELGTQIKADADIDLPWVFYRPPRHKVKVTFALWCGMNERILDDQPFPVQKELFARTDGPFQRNVLKFIAGTVGLPFLLIKNYFQEGKNVAKAIKKANQTVYQFSGYNYSPRQRHTDYFAVQYEKYAAKIPVPDPHTVLFLSERLPEEEGNLSLIKRRMEKDPDIKVTEFIRTKTVDILKKSELKECARKCAGAGVIILEDFYPQLHRLSIRKDTKIVQLWHACGAFKTFGLTRMGKPGGAPQSSMNHRNYDLASVSSESIRGIYAEAFAIPTSKVKALGVARTDCLFDPDYKKEKKNSIYEKYPVLKNHKIVLFAPTFRGDGNKDAYYPEEVFDINRFMEKMPEDTICIVKHHPFVHQTVCPKERFADRVLDLTGKDHINDLMLVTDLLITDYSSSIFEAAILNIPMIFYAFDKEEYIGSRDFYFDYDQMAPGAVEETFEELVSRVNAFFASKGEKMSGQAKAGKEALLKKQKQFHEVFLGALDGQSTERIYQYIKEKYCTKTGFML